MEFQDVAVIRQRCSCLIECEEMQLIRVFRTHRCQMRLLGPERGSGRARRHRSYRKIRPRRELLTFIVIIGAAAVILVAILRWRIHKIKPQDTPRIEQKASGSRSLADTDAIKFSTVIFSFHKTLFSLFRFVQNNIIIAFQCLSSITRRNKAHIIKISLTLIILLLCVILTWITCSKYLTMELNLSQAFKSTESPTKGNSQGSSIQINGVDGGKAVIGFTIPRITRKGSGEIEFGVKEATSESLALTPKKQEEIKANLSELDPQRWQVLTKLPSPIFRYNMKLISDLESPNVPKKISHFLVTRSDGNNQKLMPGQKIILGNSLQIEDISRTLSTTKIDLVYRAGVMGMYMNFYDKDGKLVSQATGKIDINPTFFTVLTVFVGIWVILLGFVTLLKNTFLVSKEFEQIIDHFKRQS